MRKWLIAAISSAMIVGGTVGAAVTDGSPSIDAAPELSLGVTDRGEADGGARYWRVTLRKRDVLTVNLSNEGSTEDRTSKHPWRIRFCLFDPSVTDFTVGESDCAEQTQVALEKKGQIRFVAPTAGRWTIGAIAATCFSFKACVNSNNKYRILYAVAAYVRHFTSTTIRGPNVVNPRARVTFRGTVAGADGGRVQLHVADGTRPWRPLGTARLSANGTFAITTAAPGVAGQYRLRASFRGDDTHLPSQALWAFRVRAS